MTNKATCTVQTEGTVQVDIMNREGHQTRFVIYDEVKDVVRDEMGQGKWASVYGNNGSQQVYTQYERIREDILQNQDRLSDTQKIQLIVALTGGSR